MASLLIATTHATAAGMAVVHDATTRRCLASSDAGIEIETEIETGTAMTADGHDATATIASSGAAGHDAIVTSTGPSDADGHDAIATDSKARPVGNSLPMPAAFCPTVAVCVNEHR